MTGIEQFDVALPHGITLACRAAGEPGRPVMVFLHGFPQAAFVWDAMLLHWSAPEHGGYRCIAPNLRGYAGSSAPADVQAYRARHLVQDISALARALVKEAGLVLLDEPLANLDYKLREELRAEIPKIFEESGAIFVYATTEPEEALLLGGHTATLWEGRVTQFGPTPQVYRRPADATTARVFSDPPMNFVPCVKHGHRVSFGDHANAPADGPFAALPDGRYMAGFRANHLSLNAHSGSAVAFPCKVAVTEITGSESFLHLNHGADRWVGLVQGVHDLAPGTEVSVWLDPAHVYVFAEDGALVAPAAYALAA
jgi:glycerol transport system ATP-binding protein